MKKNNLMWIIICNLLGALLLGSWFACTPGGNYHGLWLALDKSIFYFFNEMLATSKAFALFVGIVNLRAFDVIAFIAMLAIYYSYYRKSNVEGKRWLFCIGVAMLFSAVIIKQFDKLLPIDRVSASVYFDQLYHNVNWVSQLSGLPAKDRAASSFPGDHGMMLLIFAVYMWKYIGKDAFLKGLAVFVIFSLPRIMGGAHWFTDVYVGSVSFVLLVLSWILLSPAADMFISWLEPKVPLKFFVKKRD